MSDPKRVVEIAWRIALADGRKYVTLEDVQKAQKQYAAETKATL